MKKQLSFLMMGLWMSSSCLFAQTYVNEMDKASVERDCIMGGGAALFTEEGPAQYDDLTYVQKSSAETPTSFIFNRDIWGNKNLTGFRLNILLRMGDDPTQWVKVEYSKDEETYFEIPDMKVEFSYDDVLGNAYWSDVYFQSALPAGVKEIKVTLLAKPEEANWIPCYRKTEIFYETGTPYEYVTPPNVIKEAETFAVDFETPDTYIVSTAGSENPASTAEVVANPHADAVNGSANVLKFVQAPSDAPWGWGNGDWFGAAIAFVSGNGKQLTKITENNKYLHLNIYRADNTKFGTETWGGNADLKNTHDFTASNGWQDLVVDLTAHIGQTFTEFYISPNAEYETNGITEAQTMYIDNVRLSAEPNGSGLIKMFGDQVTIETVRDGVIVNKAIGQTIAVYSVDGKVISMATITSDRQAISLQAGMYIVKVGQQAVKALIQQ